MKPEKIDTISIKIPHAYTKQFDQIAAKEDRTRSSVMRMAFQQFLEDYFDVADAKKVVKEYKKNPHKKLYTLEEVMKGLGITKKDLKELD